MPAIVISHSIFDLSGIHSFMIIFQNCLSAARSQPTDSPWCRVADGLEDIYDYSRCSLLLPGLFVWVISGHSGNTEVSELLVICSPLLFYTIAGKDEKVGPCHFQAFMHSNQWGCLYWLVPVLEAETEIFLFYNSVVEV